VNGPLPGVGVIRVTLGRVLRLLIAVVMAVVVIVLIIVTVLLTVVVLVAKVVDDVLLLWLGRLLLLAQDTSGHQLPNYRMASSAL
jgi:hypothetical protein